MTREDKLYSMRMQDLVNVAEKLGIKINAKAAKSKAIEKILEAEHIMEATDKELEKQEQENLKTAEQETKPQIKEKESKLTPKRGVLIEYQGKSQNICAWAKELGKSANTLYARIYKLGWSVEDAFTK